MDDKRRRCDQINIQIQNQRLQIDSLQRKLHDVLNQINPTLTDMERARQDVMLAQSERNLDVGTSFIKRSNPKRGLAEAGVNYAIGTYKVHTARQEMNSLRTKYDSLLADQRYCEREIDGALRELRGMEAEYRRVRC